MRQALTTLVWIFRISRFKLAVAVPLFFFSTDTVGWATDTNAGSDLPTSSLRPPRDEISPSFWDQHGTEIIVGTLGLVAVLGVTIWLLTRPKPIEPIAPALKARHELEPLSQTREDGALLSLTSQILRRYVSAVFALPSAELTTSEVCGELRNRKDITPQLSDDLGRFLRECDVRKFSPTPAGPPLGVVQRAIDIVQRVETERAEHTRAAAASGSGAAPAPAESTDGRRHELAREP